MANTLTGLIPTLYEALDVVSREMVGYIPAVTRNASAARAAKGQKILVPIVPAATAADSTPAVTAPNTGDQTIGNVEIEITKSRHVPVRWEGEEEHGLRGAGTYDSIFRDRIAQAMRTLVNEIEVDLHAAAYQGASRATGTAGTAPFNTADNLSDAAALRQILDDNGAPVDGRRLVLGSAAVNNLYSKQAILLKANENASAAFRRTGSISEVPLNGFALYNSAAVKPVTKGTGASYVTSGSTAVGVSDVALVTGTGTVNPGDIVTFAADTANKYVVNKGVAAPGTITLGSPGARMVIPTANALTVGGNYTPNVAFHSSAIQLVARAPHMPSGGDMGDDSVIVTDTVSGLSFEVAVYRQFMQVVYHVRIAWGCAAIKPDHIATLAG